MTRFTPAIDLRSALLQSPGNEKFSQLQRRLRQVLSNNRVNEKDKMDALEWRYLEPLRFKRVQDVLKYFNNVP